MSVLRVIERDLTIAYKVAYTRIPGSDHTCALFLSQVAYWCGNSEDGWAWLTHDRLEAQTGMGRKSQDRAASFWISVGVLQKTLRGLPAKIHYSVDFDRLEVLLLATKVVRTGQAALSELDKHSIGDSLKIPSCAVDVQQQPESAGVISITSPSQTLTQTPDQPLSSRATPPPPSSAAPIPRQKRGPAIPPLDEFVTWAEKNHPGWEREAAEWHKRLASQDWINGAGKPILNAKSTFNTWMSNGWIKRLPQSQSAKRFLSPAEMQAQEEAAAQNYTPGFRS